MLGKSFRELLRYPSAIAGLFILLLLIGLAIYAVVKIPYSQAISLWRGSDNVWYRTPKIAAPAWTNWFRHEKLVETKFFSTKENPTFKTVESMSSGEKFVIVFPFDFEYDTFPQDITLYFTPTFSEKELFASVTLLTPDGRELKVMDGAIGAGQVFYIAQDKKLIRRYGDFPQQSLLAIPDSEPLTPLKGRYELRISAISFEADSDLDVELVIFGQVYGIAGTDHLRRDLSIALLWGTPVALGFGLLAAMGTTFTSMAIAAIGAWYGGWVDDLIQRITEVNLVLPLLPILMMIGIFYSRSIWVILGAVFLLSVFGGAIKTYRANFMQIREAPYIEAARSYGANNGRIIFLYLVPRLIPLLIPQLVNAIPGFVFTEASLAVLGLGDPSLPTWGKVINDAYGNGAQYLGYYYWVLEPAVLLILTGLAFALLGFSLDRVFNPRMRQV
jgi:peptide/nickel transport system permease protein